MHTQIISHHIIHLLLHTTFPYHHLEIHLEGANEGALAQKVLYEFPIALDIAAASSREESEYTTRMVIQPQSTVRIFDMKDIIAATVLPNHGAEDD